MKNLTILLLPLLLVFSQQVAQKEYRARVSPSNKGYAYENYPLPDRIRIYDLDKKATILRVDQVTLLEVWSTKAGGQPEFWQRIRDIETNYKSMGLKTISINFENGVEMRVQHQRLLEFFSRVEKPEHFYYDGLGYVIDFLKVPGFPHYYLVDADGTVVFRTSGWDEQGMDLLQAEIETRLEK